MPISIKTNSGGTVNLYPSYTGIKGHELLLHIDQSSNINSGDDEAAIAINVEESKKLILLLDEYVSYVEGKKYVAVIDYDNKAEEKNESDQSPDILNDVKRI